MVNADTIYVGGVDVGEALYNDKFDTIYTNKIKNNTSGSVELTTDRNGIFTDIMTRFAPTNTGTNFWTMDTMGVNYNANNAVSQRFIYAGDKSIKNKVSWGFASNIGSFLCGTANNQVGIGTTNPTEKLEVAGNAKINGLLINNYSRIALGGYAGLTGQSSGGVAIGQLCGATNQGLNSTAIGYNSGGYHQGNYCVAVGNDSGVSEQGANSVAIGVKAGQIFQGTQSVAIGVGAGQYSQGQESVAIGYNAGCTGQTGNALAVGCFAGQENQSANSIAIGNYSGMTSQSSESTAIGVSAGAYNQGTSSLSIGNESGMYNQGNQSVAVGKYCGMYNQGNTAVAVGFACGMTGQGNQGLGIGVNAGTINQGASCVAVGFGAGAQYQGGGSIAIGQYSGQIYQGSTCVSIGNQCGRSYQANAAISIGYQAGFTGQGQNSIAIGRRAGYAGQHAQTTILNAQNNVVLNSVVSDSLYIAPIRNTGGYGCLSYNNTSKEINYSPAITVDSLNGLSIFSGKGLTGATGCYTVGTEDNEVNIFANLLFTSNTQSNYSILSNNSSTVAYKAFGTGSNYFDTELTYTNTGVVLQSTLNKLVVDGISYYGAYVRIYNPTRVNATSLTFFNNLNSSGQYIKSYLVAGSLDGSTLFLLANKTITTPTASLVSTTLNTNFGVNYLYFQITSITPRPSGLNDCDSRVSQITYSGIYNNRIRQSIYFPQSVEVGRSRTGANSLPSVSLTVNGDTDFKGNTTVSQLTSVSSLKIGDFSTWTPSNGSTYLLPDFYGTSASGDGYYVLPGGLCLQWGWKSDSAYPQVFYYKKKLTVVYSCQIQRINNIGSSAPGATNIVSITGDYVQFDSTVDSTDESSVMIFVVGKI